MLRLTSLSLRPTSLLSCCYSLLLVDMAAAATKRPKTDPPASDGYYRHDGVRITHDPYAAGMAAKCECAELHPAEPPRAATAGRSRCGAFLRAAHVHALRFCSGHSASAASASYLALPAPRQPPKPARSLPDGTPGKTDNEGFDPYADSVGRRSAPAAHLGLLVATSPQTGE